MPVLRNESTKLSLCKTVNSVNIFFIFKASKKAITLYGATTVISKLHRLPTRGN